MENRREQIQAVFLAALMVLSVVAIGAGSVAGSAVAETEPDTQHSTDVVDSHEQSDDEVHVDPELEESDEIEQVYLIFDQYDEAVSEDRERAIAQLQEHAEQTQVDAHQQINRIDGIELVNTYWITNAIRAEVDASTVDVDELTTIDGVHTIQIRPEYRIPEPVEPDASPDVIADEGERTYGLDQINASETWNDFGTQGEDVKVAVLDTGFDTDHQDLDLYTEDADDPTYPGGWVEIGPDGDPIEDSEPYDTHYHGTHVGGTVGANAPADGDTPSYGVAPNVDLQHGLVLPGGSGADSDTIAGFEYVVEEMDTDVVSMSFGAGCGLFGPVYQDAWIPVIQNANDLDVHAVTSSGNSGEGCVGSPANIHDSFAIGASDESGDIADFSSGNTIAANNWDNLDPAWPDEWIKPDVSAPGEDVLSAMPDDEYDYLSGTSMAAPHVSGTIALMLSANEDLTAGEIQDALEETAWKPDGEPDDKDVRYGHGIIDAYAAVEEVADPAHEYELGDVNQDGTVNVDDVRLMQEYLQGMEPEDFSENLGDMNRDGEVTTTDLNLLQQKVQGTLDEGEIAVSSVDAPGEADRGDTIEITADLENLGEEGVIQEIELYTNADGDGEPLDTTVVDLAAPGVDDPVDHPAETTITFDVDTSGLETGEHEFGVFSEDDSGSDTTTILDSQFDVSNLEAPDEADQGEVINVSADIVNTGNAEDTQSVEFRLDDLDDPVLSQNVTLEPDEETTVNFEVDTSDLSEGTYDHGIFTEDDSETATITINEAFFDVEITDAPETVSVGEQYDVTAAITNTGDAPSEQEIVYDLGSGGGDIAVVDVADDPEQGEAVADVLNASLDTETYDVDLVLAEDLLEEMDQYDTFVVQRLGSDDLAEDFLNTLGDQQSTVYLDSHQGGSAATYADGIYRLNNVQEDPAERDSEGLGTSSDPVTIDIEQNHPIFAGVGETGDTVEVYTGTTTWGSWFGDYSGSTLADADFGNGYGGPSVAISDNEDEVLLTAVARDFFTNEDDFTSEGNQLLVNAVEYATTGSVTVDAQTVDHSNTVHLEPGESESVTFTSVVPEDTEPGDANHIVASEDDQDLAPVTIEDDGANWNVEGTVFDGETDEPIEDATVELDTGDETYSNVTDVDGKYGLEDVPAGEHEITATAEGYAETTESIDVPEEGTVTKDLGLQIGTGAIGGEVTASDDGAPVENVTVVAENDEGDVHETTTDTDGEYTLDSLAAGTYVVNVAETPPGYEPEEIVTVEAGEHVDGVDFEIDRTSGAIEGTVTNAAGVPIEDANVVDADGDAFNATTDANGEYHIEDVTPGTQALRVIDGDDESTITFVEVEAGETTTADITIGAFFEVSGLDAPQSAEQDEEITVTAEVTNVGDEEATRSAFYFPPGTDFGDEVPDVEPEMIEQITLEGGESTTVEFVYQIPDNEPTGESEHGVSVDEVVSAPITIEADDPEPAYFAVSDLDGPDAAEQGEEVTISATIENTGDEADSQLIFQLFNEASEVSLGELSYEEIREAFGPEMTEEVSLEGGESTTVEFTHEITEDAGEYEYAVSTLQETAVGTMTVEESTSAQPGNAPASPPGVPSFQLPMVGA